MLLSTYVKARLALEDFKKDQRGVTAIEYAIIGVAVATIVGAAFATTGENTLGGALNSAMGTITSKIASAG
ncbi:Flp family type IVb pilin [Vibrio albus]|uniref:Flp family type IVb pilin n=1 Tax=Vibrio albus TaxID=2200953 RepID=A0A2U3BEL7_9VIBR|nr:Flp family type IVb pilin [Vibrio albus]PWI35227.1 Flp family type IVb pilin [Vibrio albus]